MTVSGLRADLTLRIAAGGAVVGGLLPSLDAELTSGSLSATGVFGQVRLALAAGNAQVWFTEPPRLALVTLDVGHGNVTLGAADTTMVARAHLGHGQTRGGSDAGAGRLEIGGQIEVGDLTLRAPTAR